MMTEIRALWNRVRALQRKLAREIAVVRIRDLADDYCRTWYEYRSNNQLPPDPHPFIQRVIQAGYRLSASLPPAHNYLDDCRRRDAAPDPFELFCRLLPWSRAWAWR